METIWRNWRDLIKPREVRVETSRDGQFARFVAEPLERGFGVTMGNSLRRVLLSSLQGTAVTAVKIEGVAGHEDVIDHLVGSGIPVMGHIGLTPQAVHQLGGYRYQGRGPEEAARLRDEARTLEDLGAFALVVECVPSALATTIARERRIPTIGIGAGAGTDGQVLVLSDLLGLDPNFQPRFVRRYVQGHEVVRDVLQRFARDVREARFPAQEEVLA